MYASAQTVTIKKLLAACKDTTGATQIIPKNYVKSGYEKSFDDTLYIYKSKRGNTMLLATQNGDYYIFRTNNRAKYVRMIRALKRQEFVFDKPQWLYRTILRKAESVNHPKIVVSSRPRWTYGRVAFYSGPFNRKGIDNKCYTISVLKTK
ncbi:MAG: hypothetical protein M0D57_03480 [Sphingobacteriales bacterium JAD_PAG50586_3]|nr:MAG: hypothetical protein M0D57_03480 [Sphingobacteriales bacterium JAD_PAG50586_3]